MIFENDNYSVYIVTEEGKRKYAIFNKVTEVLEETVDVLPMAMSLAVNWDMAIKKINKYKDNPEEILLEGVTRDDMRFN